MHDLSLSTVKSQVSGNQGACLASALDRDNQAKKRFVQFGGCMKSEVNSVWSS